MVYLQSMGRRFIFENEVDLTTCYAGDYAMPFLSGIRRGLTAIHGFRPHMSGHQPFYLKPSDHAPDAKRWGRVDLVYRQNICAGILIGSASNC